MKLMKSLDFVNVVEPVSSLEEQLTPGQMETWKNIKQGFVELKMMEEGKLKARPIQELLDELWNKYDPQFWSGFKRLSKKYYSIRDDLTDLIKSLQQNPLQGESLGRDCYKVRMKISAKKKGKSGGSRVITCVKIMDQEITLISIYDKSEQDNISDSFLMQLLSEGGLVWFNTSKTASATAITGGLAVGFDDGT